MEELKQRQASVLTSINNIEAQVKVCDARIEEILKAEAKVRGSIPRTKAVVTDKSHDEQERTAREKMIQEIEEEKKKLSQIENSTKSLEEWTETLERLGEESKKSESCGFEHLTPDQVGGFSNRED